MQENLLMYISIFEQNIPNMSHNLLKGKKGIIFGALNDMSIAWKVAERAHEEGATFTLTNAPIAMRMGAINDLAKKTNSKVIPADATSVEDLKNLFNESQEILGGKIDFVLHSIGMSPNVRKKKKYSNLNYEWYKKTLDVSAMSLHKVLQVSSELDAMNEWGSVVALSYIAAQRIFPDYNDMADAKSLLESITRSFGYHYGTSRKVRINTISQSPTVTTAGSGVTGFDKFIDFSEKMSPLGNAGSLDCANYCISMFSDLTKYVTMQNLFHDGGFSSTGVTEAVMDRFGE
jgi:enoyl-[acyl-carrier protein] reductase I|tara:strand:- start:770 stop:1636 length:867 start_codon:yes stop_codon:yes gene_type:complete